MSLRCIFVVSLIDSKLLYQRVFPTVECRWIKQHPSGSTLPAAQDLLDPLLNELGVLQPSIFLASRDSCKKKLEAPLFWIPLDTSSSSPSFCPIVIVECHARLLCGVPYLDQLQPTGMTEQSECRDPSFDVVIVLELLSKLSPIVQLPVVKMNSQLNSAIQQWLPFGRASGHHYLEGKIAANKPLSGHSKGMWMRSKPKLEVQVKEEVRMVATSSTTVTELYGTVHLNSPETEADLLSGICLNVQFTKLTDIPSVPTVLFHPSVIAPETGSSTIRIRQTERSERSPSFTLCHYSCTLEEPPIQAVLKVRPVGPSRVSIYIQLRIGSVAFRTTLNRLEVRLPVPAGNSGRFGRILTGGSHQQPVQGFVSLLKEGAVLLWNLTPLATSSSSSSLSSTTSPSGGSSKFKEDMALNVDLDLTSSNVSLTNAEANIMFSTTSTTVSGAQVTLADVSSPDVKLLQRSEVKNSWYKVWNYQAATTI